jgi:hypothetical protein
MISKHDATWKIVETHANERLERLRIELESETISVERTTQIRARIRAYKDVLTWADAPQDVRSDPIHFDGQGDT